jgi:hypothetical protein
MIAGEAWDRGSSDQSSGRRGYIVMKLSEPEPLAGANNPRACRPDATEAPLPPTTTTSRASDRSNSHELTLVLESSYDTGTNYVVYIIIALAAVVYLGFSVVGVVLFAVKRSSTTSSTQIVYGRRQLEQQQQQQQQQPYVEQPQQQPLANQVPTGWEPVDQSTDPFQGASAPLNTVEF